MKAGASKKKKISNKRGARGQSVSKAQGASARLNSSAGKRGSAKGSRKSADPTRNFGAPSGLDSGNALARSRVKSVVGSAKSVEVSVAKSGATEVSTRVAIYPGSFDPITMGHVDIIERVARVFDRVIVLIASAPEKQGLFSPDERKALIEKSLSHLTNVEVDIHEGLTIDYARKQNAKVLIRGLRAVVDFEYEVSMANMNFKLDPDIETLLVFARPEFYFLSSRSVKEVARHQGKLEGLVPAPVQKSLVKVFKKGKVK